MVKIEKVIKDSLADVIGIAEGDVLVSINGHEINDVLDYRFYLANKLVTLVVQRGDKTKKFKIELAPSVAL